MDINHKDETPLTSTVEEPKSVEKAAPTEELKTENPTSLLEKPKDNFEDTPGVDLCFMIDCTGSMSSYIRMACNKVKDIMAQFKEIYPCSEIRVGIVGYRDVQDHNRFDILPFTYCGETAKDFLDKLSANGGGDTPEDVNGAFQKMLFQMEWKMPVKVVVHIADAPCHGKDFHNYDDDHPQGYVEDLAWDKVFGELVEKHLDYMFLKLSDTTNLMFEKFKALADEKGATKEELCFVQELSLYNMPVHEDYETPIYTADLGCCYMEECEDDIDYPEVNCEKECFEEKAYKSKSCAVEPKRAVREEIKCEEAERVACAEKVKCEASSVFAEKITGQVLFSVNRAMKKK